MSQCVILSRNSYSIVTDFNSFRCNELNLIIALYQFRFWITKRDKNKTLYFLRTKQSDIYFVKKKKTISIQRWQCECKFRYLLHNWHIFFRIVYCIIKIQLFQSLILSHTVVINRNEIHRHNRPFPCSIHSNPYLD